MKKILIFYGSYGGGHLSAAKTICSYIEKNYSDKIEVKLVDCIEYINKYLNKVSTEAYKELSKKAPWAWKHVYKNSQTGALSYISNTTNKLMSYKLNSLLQDFKPDLIISTHPFSTQMCAILKQKDKINCKLATILTDYHIHAQWLVLYKNVDYFFVANEQMKIDMVSKGVREQRIFVTGIPVSEKFLTTYDKNEVFQKYNLSPNKETLLFFASGESNSGRNTSYMILKILIRLFKDLQVFVLSGKNKKMNQRFNKLVKNTNSQNRIKIIEYSNDVPELMSVSMGVITKAGGLTLTEALVSHLPIAIVNPIPGQEEENAEYLVNNGAAVWIKKEDSLVRVLKYISRNREKLEHMKKQTELLANKNSTKDICEILLKNI